ncbi:hypothetical protein [Thalassobaculum sp.]|uniref:hypothetical protein n=1 Tax=Thalassobaculum sp. TaxID=2022740 RepID=UPI0032F04974
MTLPAITDSLEDLPEAVRPHYVATEDGRWRLDADGVEDVAGLKSALEKERTARKALKAELAALEGEALTDADADSAASVEETEAPADPRLAAVEARLIEAEARTALQVARGVPELLLPILRDRLAVVDDGAGRPVVRVLGDTGKPQRREGGNADYLTVADLVGALRADPIYGRAFEGSGKGGSGAPATGRGEPGPLTVSAEDPRAIARHIADIAAGRVRVA